MASQSFGAWYPIQPFLALLVPLHGGKLPKP